MTTFNPYIDASQVAQESEVSDVTAPLREMAAENLPNQYTMARQQYLSFTQEEADQINQTLDLMEACTKTRVSPNKLIKQAALQKSRQVLSQGEK